MKTINEILSGGCKPGELVVLCGSSNSGRSYYQDILAKEIRTIVETQKQLSNENDNG